MEYACPIKYNAEYRQVETQRKTESTTGSDTDDSAGISKRMTQICFLAAVQIMSVFHTTCRMTICSFKPTESQFTESSHIASSDTVINE